MNSEDVGALREYFKGEVGRLESMLSSEKELRLMLQQEQIRALEKAEEALSRRLDGMNEIREQLNMQAQTFLPRETFDATLTQWVQWRGGIDNQMALMQGRGFGVQTMSDFLLKVIPVIVAIIATGFAIYFGTQ